MKYLTLFLLTLTCSAQVVLQYATIQSATFSTGGGGGGNSPTPEFLWWKLNEGSGTSISGSSSGGGDSGSTDSAWLTGKSGSGSCLDFNGSSQDAATSSAITYSGTVVTVCFWLYADVNNVTQVIVESGNPFFGVAGRYVIYLDSGPTIYASLECDVGRRVEYCTGPSTGSWVHVMAVFDGSTAAGDVKILLDGSAQTTTVDSSGTGNALTALSSEILYVGARGGSTSFFNGRIDDLRVYAGDKSSSVASIMNDPQ